MSDTLSQLESDLNGPLVASAHLVVEGQVPASEFEFGMILTWNAFSRWATSCMSAAGAPDLGMVDIMVLNHICHRGKQKKLADICFTLNFADTHIVSYSLRKLSGSQLITSKKIGKEVFYSPTKKGLALVERYVTVRTKCLVPSIDQNLVEKLSATARTLREMSGTYDQAARAASSLV
ncbi:winged helix DNA-binding protein [Pseudomonas sp. 7P_10.2_Bac1]|uniref:winged helix DNA-binding protein n=1 Tax=Pseudomonas sp. 7P_10.2_Bac1 TaxID=2971614 RepID=UPI0021C5C853|nr:winged helix DNA-binding protein [Pseudomonas sp. 7P_10.2_Bac1]MCU1728591.1 winged helix DNA-binding protein [Pseudomonas sp. 7P_10.2_Bac1]